MALKSYKDVRRIRILRGASTNQRRYCLTRWIAWRGADQVFVQWSDQVAAQHQHFIPETKKALGGLLEITAIQSVRLRSHELVIDVADAYDWEELDREILSIIRVAFYSGDDFQKVEVQDRAKPAATSPKTPALTRMTDGGKRGQE